MNPIIRFITAILLTPLAALHAAPDNHDAIDEDKNGRISPDEYLEFQAFKQKHQDWQVRLKAKVSGKFGSHSQPSLGRGGRRTILLCLLILGNIALNSAHSNS